MSKLYAICSGVDWADESVEHIVLNDSEDIDELRKNYLDYMKIWRTREYISFIGWIVLEGHGRWATEDDVQEYYID